MTLPKVDINEDHITQAFGAMDEVESLGFGTYGTTFRVVRDDEEYTIKVVHLPGLPTHLWDRELAALSLTDHPNLLSLRDHGIVNLEGVDLPYFTSEYINGGTLRQHIDSGKRPANIDELRGLFTGLLAGVSELHDLGGLHRDIKPENVALRDADWGQPVILDFGLARLADMSTHTIYPALRGTAAYMSPEQLRGKQARTRSDVFALAVTVYEAGTGTHPFPVSHPMTVQELDDRISSGPPDDPSDHNPDAFDAQITKVLLRLLSYRGHERLSAADALAALEECD